MGSAAKESGCSPRTTWSATSPTATRTDQTGKLQQRNEISTEREADAAVSGEESPLDARVSWEIENPTGTLTDNNVGAELVRK
jgi:hypothetical protein